MQIVSNTAPHLLFPTRMSLPSHGPAPCDDADGHLVTAGPLTPPPDSAGTTADEKALRHSIAEDVQGMVLATMVASLGLAIFAKGGLMIGGMAGMAFLLHYAMGWNFGLVFVLVNLPFYWVALRRMGWEFTLKTFAAVTACGVLTDLLPRWIDFSHINPLYSAIVGGALSGLGILFFIRHRASLGGIGIPGGVPAAHPWLERGQGADVLRRLPDGGRVLRVVAVEGAVLGHRRGGAQPRC